MSIGCGEYSAPTILITYKKTCRSSQVKEQINRNIDLKMQPFENSAMKPLKNEAVDFDTKIAGL
jgi:hypothetical protein